jgi:hypothetical protein
MDDSKMDEHVSEIEPERYHGIQSAPISLILFHPATFHVQPNRADIVLAESEWISLISGDALSIWPDRLRRAA